MIKLLPEVNIVTREFASNSDAFAVEDFFVESLDMRVFVLNMYVNHARLYDGCVVLLAYGFSIPSIEQTSCIK